MTEYLKELEIDPIFDAVMREKSTRRSSVRDALSECTQYHSLLVIVNGKYYELENESYHALAALVRDDRGHMIVVIATGDLNQIKEANRIYRLGLEKNNQLVEGESSSAETEEEEPASSSFPSVELSTLELPTRVNTRLRKKGILTSEDVFNCSTNQLLVLPHFGKWSFATLRQKLIDRGLADPNQEGIVRIQRVKDNPSDEDNETEDLQPSNGLLEAFSGKPL